MKTRARESGQAMILFAVLAPLLLMVMGLAVEGGNLFSEYRHLQAAADMAALVGAQDLPCPGNLTCDQVKSETYWCAYANYYGGSVPGYPSNGCSSSGASQASVASPVSVAVSVPPVSCSPYDSLDYGSNASCPGRTASNTANSYVEVQLSEAIHIPIFQVTFTMYTHAIARHGEPSPKDFAMTILNPTLSGALTLGGTKSNGLIVVGSVMSDSTSTTGGGSIDTTGSAGQVTCDGGWYTSAGESIPGGLYSATGGTSQYAPPACLNKDGTTCDSPTVAPSLQTCDSSTVWHPQWPYIQDPYCTSSNPPTVPSVVATTDCRGTATASTTTNCTPCTQTAQVFTWNVGSARSTGTWTSAGSLGQLSGGQNVEFFPGIYPKGISMSVAANKSAQVYFNPGVYTMEGDLAISGQTTMCIYGAPACDNNLSPTPLSQDPSAKTGTTCQNADFTPSTSPYYLSSSTWYYYCSPWGQWDTSSLPNRTVTTTAPTFTDGKTPMNGVTFYMVNGSDFKMTGGGFAELAFPNPCPGTGTPGTNSVPFFDPSNLGSPAGVDWANSSFGYTYNSAGVAGSDGAQPSKYVYPNPDLSYAEELKCLNPSTAPAGTTTPLNAGNEWTNEFGQASGHDATQHIHFLVFARDGNTQIDLAGNGGQNWFGILYNPGSVTNYGTSGCSNTNKCTTSITGNAGAAAAHGPAMMIGQIVADNFSYSGDAITQLFYRPCNPSTAECNTGPGSALVQ